jgi:uncharacterized protein YndB with AHSA1/START domain
MAQPTDGITPIKPAPVVITRRFAAPRALVFSAWSSAEHMRRWFAPEGITIPAAEVEFRPGGVCNLCFRSPDGNDSWLHGAYQEIAPPDRLVIRFRVAVGPDTKFTALTTVTFADDGAGTRLTVEQAYEVYDPAFLSAIAMAPQGWGSTLDNLAREVAS